MVFKQGDPIYFYISKKECPNLNILPKKSNEYLHIFRKEKGTLSPSAYAWTYQTYLNLIWNGINCKLVNKIPKKGIILFTRHSIKKEIKPNPKQFFICMKAEHKPLKYAQLHVIMNKKEASIDKKFYYMPHWSMPGIIPRAKNRGNKFENIAFIGEDRNLDINLKTTSWERYLKKNDLKWNLIGSDLSYKWNDYQNIDLIVAVREFNSKNQFKSKPALKLINAWLAGVPAILGPESAYQAERKSELDYIEVKTYEELIDALKKLKENPELRKKMIENGLKRCKEYTIEKISQRWKFFITNIAIPAYEEWINLPEEKRKEFFDLRREYYETKDITVFKKNEEPNETLEDNLTRSQKNDI